MVSNLNITRAISASVLSLSWVHWQALSWKATSATTGSRNGWLSRPRVDFDVWCRQLSLRKSNILVIQAPIVFVFGCFVVSILSFTCSRNLRLVKAVKSYVHAKFQSKLMLRMTLSSWRKHLPVILPADWLSTLMLRGEASFVRKQTDVNLSSDVPG